MVATSPQERYHITLDFLQVMIGHRIVESRKVTLDHAVEKWFADTATDQQLAESIIEGLWEDADCPLVYTSDEPKYIFLTDIDDTIEYLDDLRRNPPEDLMNRWY